MTAMTDQIQDAPLILTIENNIAFITLNRPKQYNALSKAMLDGLLQAFAKIEADKNIRVAVIAANGKAFCAGHDLKEMQLANDQLVVNELFATCSTMMLTIAKLSVPVIAVVQGMATAAGSSTWVMLFSLPKPIIGHTRKKWKFTLVGISMQVRYQRVLLVHRRPNPGTLQEAHRYPCACDRRDQQTAP